MTIQISKSAVDSRLKGFTGKIIMPGDTEYGDSRTIFNAMIDRQPSVIAQCANVDDVVRAVEDVDVVEEERGMTLNCFDEVDFAISFPWHLMLAANE